VFRGGQWGKKGIKKKGHRRSIERIPSKTDKSKGRGKEEKRIAHHERLEEVCPSRTGRMFSFKRGVGEGGKKDEEGETCNPTRGMGTRKKSQNNRKWSKGVTEYH